MNERRTLTCELTTEPHVLLQTFIAHYVRKPIKSPALLREILGR